MGTPRLFKKMLGSQVVQWGASAIGVGYVVVVRSTSRIDLPPPPAAGPFIIAMWHGRLAMIHLLRFSDRPLVALISSHRDGQLISKCAGLYNIQTVAGSSSHGGIGAARKLIRLAREGHSLFITPDGPRGPRMHVSDGILGLARLTGLSILPTSISTSGGTELKTWDRFLVPQPFSRIAIRWGKPLRLQPNDDPLVTRAHLEAELNAVQQSADLAVGRALPNRN